MNKVVIMTDSTCDLSKELIESRKIHVVPLYVNFGDLSYRDGIDLTTPELYAKVDELGFLPKSSAVSPGEFVNQFTPWIEDGYDIVCITIGSKLSGTFQSAIIAKDMVDSNRIHVVDSNNLSTGVGLVVLKGCDLRDQGLDAFAIKQALDEIAPRVRSQFAIQTMDYLYKGGRCSALSAFLGGVLAIKPIIQVNNGKLDVYKKAIGKMTRALDIMLEDYQALYDQIDSDYVMVTHSIADKSAAYMMERIHEIGMPKALIETQAGCVISTHCGKGTIGILYILKA